VPTATSGPAPAATPEDVSYRHPVVGRIVAVGDLHGDLAATRRVLRVAGAIDGKDKWVGGNLTLVQTGDVLDRGDDEKAILELLDRLASEAASAGGAVFALLGNHETMNVAGDLRYVTPRGFRDFEHTPTTGLPAPLLAGFPEPARGRAAAFLPGGVVATRLARKSVIVVLGDSVFAHGGVLPKHVGYGIARINNETSAWMSGKANRQPAAVQAEDAPTWTRRFAEPVVEPRDCRVLQDALTRLRVTRMVVGHSVQQGGIGAACDQRVWRIDVGLSAQYGGGSAQALEIDGDKVRVLRDEPGAAQ
jgi:hypothetical protein